MGHDVHDGNDKGKNERASGGSADKPERPNQALNLALVLLLPALVGLVGGRRLRVRAV
jgi:hypothetical protein